MRRTRPNLGKAPRLGLTRNANHSRPRTGMRIDDTQKKISKRNATKLIHMLTILSLCLDHCYRTHNLAYLSSDCFLPTRSQVLIHGERGWTLAQDTCMNKAGTAHAYNITWQGTPQPHEIVIMIQHSPIT